MKKLLSVILALVLVLGLAVVPAFADETTAPTSSTTATTHPGITSVTVNSTAAYYQYDNNTGSSVVYIRAKMPNTSTWGSLQSATVVITTTGNAPSVAYNGSPITTPTPSGNAYTYTNMDLLNKRYSVTVTDGNGSYTYYLAAGFTGKVVIDSNDTLGIDSVTLGSSSTLSIYGNVVQNDFMGNTYYANNSINWTDTNIVYYITGTYTPNIGTTTAVNKSITFVSGASGASLTNNGCVNNNGTLDLSGNVSGKYIEVANNNITRKYYITAVLESSTTFVPTASTFMIDFTELSDDPDYSDYYDAYMGNIEEIEDALSDYYDHIQTTGKVFFATQSLMDVMQDYITFAENSFSFETYCSDTYLSILNGLGEFSAGSMSGWMYIDGAYSSGCIVPNVGSADYALGNSAIFTWFFTTDYGNHYIGW